MSFLSPRLVAIGAIGDTVGGDSGEQIVVQAQAARRVVFALQRDHRLKRFQCLDGALEAERTWFQMVFMRCLSDDGANEVIGQNVCPQFLANQFGSLAPQHVHLHGLFERFQIETRHSTARDTVPPVRTADKRRDPRASWQSR